MSQELYTSFLEEHKVTRLHELASNNGIQKQKIERAIRDGKATIYKNHFETLAQVTFSLVHLAEKGMTEEAVSLTNFTAIKVLVVCFFGPGPM